MLVCTVKPVYMQELKNKNKNELSWMNYSTDSCAFSEFINIPHISSV